MSAAVATRNSPHGLSTSRTHSPMDHKRNSAVKPEDKSKRELPSKDSSTASSAAKQDSQGTDAVAGDAAVRTEVKVEVEPAQPLAPPPRPQPTNGADQADYFSVSHKNHFSNEPNPFERSFGNPATDTPGKTHSLLPPVASLTSPAPLTGSTSIGRGFDWNGSLRAGPLSPAMLSGPAASDFFDSLNRPFPTPTESSLRTGLTPGGGGSMFPIPSPGTQAFINSLSGGGATPGALDFQRTALKTQKQPENNTSPTTAQTSVSRAPAASMDQPQTQSTFGQHDNDAANGLYLLAQAGNESQANNQFATPSVPATTAAAIASRNAGSVGGSNSANSGRDDGSDGDKPATRKSKRATAGKSTKNSRKAEDSPPKQPASKRTKSSAAPPSVDMSMDMDDEDDDSGDDKDGPGGVDTRKMTDEEKRKNFLERNRVAALKCRQRKKQWLQNLQNKVEIFSSENDALSAQVAQLRDEILNLKTILIAHKDCPIAQQQAQAGAYLQHGVDYNPGPNHYSMGMSAQQPVGLTGPRRFS